MTPAPPPDDGITDETLMMFADGTLDEPGMDRVARALEADPGLERRLGAFLATRDSLRGAFSKTINEPVPLRLLAAATGAAEGSAQQDGQRLPPPRTAAQARRPAPAARRRWVPMALAAGIVGMAAGLAGYLAGQGSAPSTAVAALAAAQPGELAVLAGRKDGERGALAGGLAGEVSGTYRMADRRLCRALSVEQASSRTAAEGVACIGPGGWRIELALPREPSAAPYRPAAGGGPIDALLEAGGAREPLADAEVEALVRNGWR